MPEGWVLKKKIVRSKKFRQLYGNDFAQLVYCMLIANKDAWGLHPADPESLKIALGPFDVHREPEDYFEAVRDLARVGLVRLWREQGDPWLYVEGHEKEHPVGGRRGKSAPIRIPQTNQTDADWIDLQQTAANCSELMQTDADCSELQPDRIGSDRNRREEGKGTAANCSELQRTDADCSELQQFESVSPSPPPQKSDTDNRTGTGRGSEGNAKDPPPVAPPVRSDPRADGVVDSMPGSSPGDQGSNPCRPVSSTQPNPGGADPPAPGARAGVSSVGEILGEALNQLGPAIIPDSRPTTEQHLEIQELLAEYQRAWGLEMPPIAPVHDHRRRVMEALNALGFERCKLAIHGHHREASKDGSNYGRDFIHVFPPASTGGHRQKNRCDLNRVDAFASKVRGPARRRDPPAKPRPKRDDDVNAAGLQRVREELAKKERE